jgi:hypothetical protein
MSMHFRNIQFKIQDINTYQKNTRCNATAERGARFHPTVGSATPKGFTTSHPRARPRCFETQSLTSRSSEVQDEGYSPSPLLITLCISRSSSGSPFCDSCHVCVSVCSPLPPPSTLLSSYEVACGTKFPVRWSGLRASMDGRFAPSPHLLLRSLPTYRPGG